GLPFALLPRLGGVALEGRRCFAEVRDEVVGEPGGAAEPLRDVGTEVLLELRMSCDESAFRGGEGGSKDVEHGELRVGPELLRSGRWAHRSSAAASTMRARTSRSTSFFFLRAASFSA